MDLVYEFELAWILFLQGLGTWFDSLMRLASTLGQEDFYMLIMPILYWSINANLGLRVGVMLLLSNGTNSILKAAFHTPRPYWVDPGIKAKVVETSFGMPSGHAQNAASIWGLVSAASRSGWVKAGFILLILLIGFSRIYLGVHFIHDVLLGWLAGGLLLYLFLKLEPRVTHYLKTRTLRQMLALAFISSAALGLLVMLTVTTASSFSLPDAWSSNALLADPQNVIDPFNIEGAFTLAGTWFGLLAGAAWLYHRQGGFDASGSPAQKLLRYLVGVAGIFVLWRLLGSVLPRGDDALSYALRYLRYSLVGLWISALAPLAFERLKLARVLDGKNATLSAPENPL